MYLKKLRTYLLYLHFWRIYLTTYTSSFTQETSSRRTSSNEFSSSIHFHWSGHFSINNNNRNGKIQSYWWKTLFFAVRRWKDILQLFLKISHSFVRCRSSLSQLYLQIGQPQSVHLVEQSTLTPQPRHNGDFGSEMGPNVDGFSISISSPALKSRLAIATLYKHHFLVHTRRYKYTLRKENIYYLSWWLSPEQKVIEEFSW